MSWCSGLEHVVRRDEPLAPHTWFGLGGPAQFFAEPTCVEELVTLVRRTGQEGMPARLLGGGSNVLVHDEGVAGVTIRLDHAEFCRIAVRGSTLTAGGGAKLGHLITVAVREGLAGLETLVGIPGTLGGALHSNAGSRDSDIGEWVEEVTVLTPEGAVEKRSRDELVFAFRQSNLDDLAVLEARLKLEGDDPQELTKRMQKQWIVKKASLPLSHQKAGCVFRNPRGMSAGELIDQAGLKGTRVGGAEVSQRHANFIVAEPGATTQDVLRLIELVRGRVAQRLGVELEIAIEVW